CRCSHAAMSHPKPSVTAPRNNAHAGSTADWKAARFSNAILSGRERFELLRLAASPFHCLEYPFTTDPQGLLMQRATTKLRTLINTGKFLELPAIHDPLTAKLAESIGFKTIYNGGFVTGGSSTISEPLL